MLTSSLVLVLTVLAVGVALQDTDEDSHAPSECSKIIALLKPLKNFDTSKLNGHWITLNTAIYGIDGVSTYNPQEVDPTADYSYNVNNPKRPHLLSSPDCIRQEVVDASEEGLTVRTESQKDFVTLETNSTYSFAPESKGFWMSKYSSAAIEEGINVLLLSADANKYMFLATCHETARPESRLSTNLRTSVVTLGRHSKGMRAQPALSTTEQVALLVKVAKALGQDSFAGAHLRTDCYNGPDYDSSGARTTITLYYVILLLSLLLLV